MGQKSLTERGKKISVTLTKLNEAVLEAAQRDQWNAKYMDRNTIVNEALELWAQQHMVLTRDGTLRMDPLRLRNPFELRETLDPHVAAQWRFTLHDEDLDSASVALGTNSSASLRSEFATALHADYTGSSLLDLDELRQ